MSLLLLVIRVIECSQRTCGLKYDGDKYRVGLRGIYPLIA
ncbi:Uncharacterised protein [Yersinia kristensenii]|nr:hypothetical protein ykris0001_19290 [Yersinia kristensenii ATCC 33638]EEP91078.1 hypothetical protein ykris0001_36300 [Yersinia kristensenii ATCC 33638]SUP68238.1 Uncharacterised protein [Yersinia kristensenii]